MAKLTGMDKWIEKLKKFEDKKVKDLQLGLMEAGLDLQRTSQTEFVPVDQGPLKASAFTRKDPTATKLKPAVLVGYTAEYAIYVHEIPDPPTAHGESFNIKHAEDIALGRKQSWNDKVYHERGPTQAYKFLETPARRDRGKLIQIVKKRVGG